MNKNVYLGVGVSLVCGAASIGCANAHASPGSGSPPANVPPHRPLPSVVLVHGNFVDGSGWKGVYKILTRDGYPVLQAEHSLALSGTFDAATKSKLRDVYGC